MTPDVRSRFDPWLGIALACGLALRLLYFTAPYADAHRWRQIENLAVAWNFENGSMNPFYPEAIWGGLKDSYVEMELPLVPYTLAVAWKLFGERDAYGRVIGIVCSLVLVGTMYALGRQLYSRAVGRGAALLMAISPTAVFFGRVPMTDTPMITCSALAILGYAKYFDTGSRGWAVVGAVAAMGAWLLKIPSLLILGPIAILAWQARGWRLITDRLFIGGLVLAFAGTAAWYVHALRLYEATGWTVGIWHHAGEHPKWIAVTSGTPSAFSLWSTRELLMNPQFYDRMVDRAWHIHFTPFGVAGLLVGLMLALRRPRGLVALTWFAAALSFVLVVGGGNFWHEYYQLPVIPAGAMLFGMGAEPLFRTREEDMPTWRPWYMRGARALIILVLALGAFAYSSAVRGFFRPDNLDIASVEAGRAMRAHVPPGDGVIVVEYEQGTNSPVLLYFMRHRGWSFDTLTISPEIIEQLKAHGATHFATTNYPLLEQKRPDVVEHLQKYREVPLGERVTYEAKLFELH
jgi:hypothetical protein